MTSLVSTRLDARPVAEMQGIFLFSSPRMSWGMYGQPQELEELFSSEPFNESPILSMAPPPCITLLNAIQQNTIRFNLIWMRKPSTLSLQ